MSLSEMKRSLWRGPLISVVAGWLYVPCYVRIVLRFGVIEPGVIDGRASLLTCGLLLLATLVLGGLLALRGLTRREIFRSAALVVGYAVLLELVRLLFGITSGPAAVVLMRLSAPLEWTGFPSSMAVYLRESQGITVPFLGYLSCFVPFLFVLFGRTEPRDREEP